MYGFVEADNIWDSTESFNDLAGNAAVAKGSTYAGSNGRFTFGVRNSRLGFRMRAPEFHHIRASAMLEMDFLGNEAPIGYAQPYQISENAFFTSPAFRIRHINLKVETPSSTSSSDSTGSCSVGSRSTTRTRSRSRACRRRSTRARRRFACPRRSRRSAITFEVGGGDDALAASATRGCPRDRAASRLAINKWTGVQTAGSTGTSIQPLSFAVTADVRQFNAPEFAAKPKLTERRDRLGRRRRRIRPDPSRAQGTPRATRSRVNAEYAYGTGIADLYTSLNAGALGVVAPALPNPTMANPAPTFNPDVDPALADFSPDGISHRSRWQTFLVGLQYYLPVGRRPAVGLGKLLASVVEQRVPIQGGRGRPRRSTNEWFADGNLFFDATPAVRLGFEYAWFRDSFADGTFAVNHRVQLSAFYLF